jgi:hypothetical protein
MLYQFKGKYMAKTKEERKPFKIGSFTESGAKVMIKRYTSMGYKLISTKYDSKKEMYYNTFK